MASADTAAATTSRELHELQTVVADGIAWITLNRPERKNALTIPMRERFLAAVQEYDRSDKVRCIVVQGADGAFCAGGDVTAQAERSREPIGPAQHRAEYLRLPGHCALALLRCAKPTLAAIDGPAAGAGVSLALLCDVRVASDRAFLAVPFLDRGLVPDWLLMQVLPSYVGIGRATDIFYGQERISSEKAEAWGLFSSVFDAASFPAGVRSTAERLAGLPPIAVRLLKETLRARMGDLDTLLAAEASAQATCLTTSDHAEGARAFLEKRRPTFAGQ